MYDSTESKMGKRTKGQEPRGDIKPSSNLPRKLSRDIMRK
jgi:5-methylcytosine-specific restriction endonuclease McrA